MQAANPLGINGPRPGKTTGRLRNTMRNMLSKQSGDSVFGGGAAKLPPLPKPSNVSRPGQNKPPVQAPSHGLTSLDKIVAAVQAGDITHTLGGINTHSSGYQQLAAAYQQFAANTAAMRKGTPSDTPNFQGLGGDTAAQLRAGFIKAGRPDLAKMVGTAAFRVWTGQESGGNPGAVSPANNQGLANGGIFQFWFGHDWARKYYHGGKFTMPVALQAYYAAKMFNLSPQRIREFAREIRSGSYKGWG